MDDPNQILGNAPPQSNLLSSSLDIFDLNLLPQRYQPRRIRLVAVLPWLLLLVLLAALYPSYNLAQAAHSDFKRVESEVAVLQSALESYQSAETELIGIQEQIDLALEQRDLILASYQGIDLQGSNWSPGLRQIVNIVPDNISWTTVVQQDEEIILEGIAGGYETVLDFQSRLNGLDSFSAVRIDSIEQIVDDPAEFTVVTDEDGQVLPAPPAAYTFLITISLAGGGQR